MGSLTSYLRMNGYQEEPDIRCTSNDCISKYGEKSDGAPRIRFTFITEAPEILVVRIPRFQAVWEEGEDVTSKISDVVRFDEYLNLGEFTRYKQPLMYRLQGVVAHGGESIDGGHYIAAVRQPDGINFRTVNDGVVIQECLGTGDVLELQKPSADGVQFEPYVLFYSKFDV